MHPASLRARCLPFIFLLTTSACAPVEGEGESDDVDASPLMQAVEAPPQATPLPFDRTYRVPLRVHRGDTGLSPQALASILEEVNEIWLRQAAVCFEIETVRNDARRTDGFDLWFHRAKLGCNTTANGVYCGDHDIHVLDKPSLSPVDDRQWKTRQDTARTAAHELGHGLTLQHYNGQRDSNDSLMSSGRQGFKLGPAEVTAARRRAAQKALPDAAARACAPVPVTSP